MCPERFMLCILSLFALLPGSTPLDIQNGNFQSIVSSRIPVVTYIVYQQLMN